MDTNNVRAWYPLPAGGDTDPATCAASAVHQLCAEVDRLRDEADAANVRQIAENLTEMGYIRLRAAALRVLARLEAMEWSSGMYGCACPLCAGDCLTGHRAGCELGAALAELRGASCD